MIDFSTSQLEHFRDAKRLLATAELADRIAQRYPEKLSQFSNSELKDMIGNICDLADRIGLQTLADIECFVIQLLLFTPNLHAAKEFRQALDAQSEGNRMISAIAQMPPGAIDHLVVDDAPFHWLRLLDDDN